MVRQAHHERNISPLSRQNPFILSSSKGEKGFCKRLNVESTPLILSRLAIYVNISARGLKWVTLPGKIC